MQIKNERGPVKSPPHTTSDTEIVAHVFHFVKWERKKNSQGFQKFLAFLFFNKERLQKKSSPQTHGKFPANLRAASNRLRFC